jgi:hypothetical protein
MMASSSRNVRFARVSAKRSRILNMTPRFFPMTAAGPRWTGGDIFAGDIFSNVKAGIVYPLVVELKHFWNFAEIHNSSGTPHMNCPCPQTVPSPVMQMERFKHNLCQIEGGWCSHCGLSPALLRLSDDV